MPDESPNKFVFSEASVVQAPRITVDGIFGTFGPWGVRLSFYTVPETYQPEPPTTEDSLICHAEGIVSLSWRQAEDLVAILSKFIDENKLKGEA